jgi:Mg-chelatase subunit ChlD
MVEQSKADIRGVLAFTNQGKDYSISFDLHTDKSTYVEKVLNKRLRNQKIIFAVDTSAEMNVDYKLSNLKLALLSLDMFAEKLFEERNL